MTLTNDRITVCTTATRPAASAHTGEVLYDRTIGLYIESDGTVWNVLAGIPSPDPPPIVVSLGDPSVIFVGVDGDDANTGLVAGSPKATIQAAHDALPAAGGIVWILAGTYTITTRVTVSKSVRFLGAGRDLTILQGGVDLDYQFAKFSTTPIDGIEFADITFDVQTGTSRAGLSFEYVSRFAVRRCRFRNITQWGLVVGVSNALDTTIRNTDVRVEDCEFDTIAGTYEHLLVYNARDVVISRSRFVGISASSIGLGIYQIAQDITVRDCYFSGDGFGAYYSISCNDIHFDACTFVCGTGIQGANEADNGVFGFSTVRGLTVSNCTFTTTGESFGLQLGAVYDAKVVGCTFYRCRRQGINISSGNAATIARVASRNIEVIGCSFRENNQAGSLYSIQGAIAVATDAPASTLGLKIIGCTFDDEQATATQLFPITFITHAYDGIIITGNRIQAGTGGFSVAMAGGATLGSNVVIFNNQSYTGAGLGGAPENARVGGTGSTIGFYGTTPIVKQTGVAVTAAGVHAALVALGLIT